MTRAYHAVPANTALLRVDNMAKTNFRLSPVRYHAPRLGPENALRYRPGPKRPSFMCPTQDLIGAPLG
jgi:hypothetical protein